MARPRPRAMAPIRSAVGRPRRRHALALTAFFPQVVVDQHLACGKAVGRSWRSPTATATPVADYLDECPGVPAGQGSDARPGCPTLARQVTVDRTPVARCRVTPCLSTPTNAPAGACAPAEVDVYRAIPDGRPATWLASGTHRHQGRTTSSSTSPWRAEPGFRVVAASFQDRDLADCRPGQSVRGEVAGPTRTATASPDPDDLCDWSPAPKGYLGCPKVDLSVTSRYRGPQGCGDRPGEG